MIDDIKAHIDFSHNPNLQHLTIHFSLRRFQRAANYALHAPWALLDLPHTNTHTTHIMLHTLTLVLSLDFLSLLDNLDFAHLNHALATYPHLTALRRLRFMVHCGAGIAVEENAIDAIRSRVQVWDSKGIVEVEELRTGRVFTHGK